MPTAEKVIFEYSRAGRGASDQWPQDPGPAALADLPAKLRRAAPPSLPEVGELEAVRHFTRLSQLNFSIDTHFYPLGSCTMKYNPKACNQYAMLPEFLGAPSARARIARPGLSRLPVRAAGDAQSGHRACEAISALAHGRRARRVRRRRHDPRLSPRARRCRAQRDHRAGSRARHQSRHRHHVRLRGARDPGGRARRRRYRGAKARGRPAYRRHHAHQPIDARSVRAAHRGGGADRARGRRAALLRRRQPQRHPRQGAPRATWASTSST